MMLKLNYVPQNAMPWNNDTEKCNLISGVCLFGSYDESLVSYRHFTHFTGSCNASFKW